MMLVLVLLAAGVTTPLAVVRFAPLGTGTVAAAGGNSRSGKKHPMWRGTVSAPSPGQNIMKAAQIRVKRVSYAYLP